MAFNWKSFKIRSLTAIVFVVVMLAGLLWNHWSFFILFSIIHFGCWSEYQKIIRKIDPQYEEISPFHLYGVRIAGWCMMMYASSDACHLGTITLSSIGWWMGLIFIFVLPLVEILFSKQINLKNIGNSALGLVYISLSCAMMVQLRSGDLWMPRYGDQGILNAFSSVMASMAGYVIPLVIIASLWINDTMAYIVGSLIGKTPLSAISPKKTWEGTVGGIVLCAVAITLLGVYALKGEAFYFISISLITSVVGTFGDLLESKLKRLAGIKDSGQIMPGHGGFLDRFDSLLLAVPAVWLFCFIFIR
jgi:phosphatidate cytidylyltransferase